MRTLVARQTILSASLATEYIRHLQERALSLPAISLRLVARSSRRRETQLLRRKAWMPIGAQRAFIRVLLLPLMFAMEWRPSEQNQRVPGARPRHVSARSKRPDMRCRIVHRRRTLGAAPRMTSDQGHYSQEPAAEWQIIAPYPHMAMRSRRSAPRDSLFAFQSIHSRSRRTTRRCDQIRSGPSGEPLGLILIVRFGAAVALAAPR